MRRERRRGTVLKTVCEREREREKEGKKKKPLATESTNYSGRKRARVCVTVR